MKLSKPLHKYGAYKSKLRLFKQVKDYPVALTILRDEKLPLKKRIQIMHLSEAQKMQQMDRLDIVLVCFNEVIKVSRK